MPKGVARRFHSQSKTREKRVPSWLCSFSLFITDLGHELYKRFTRVDSGRNLFVCMRSRRYVFAILWPSDEWPWTWATILIIPPSFHRFHRQTMVQNARVHSWKQLLFGWLHVTSFRCAFIFILINLAASIAKETGLDNAVVCLLLWWCTVHSYPKQGYTLVHSRRRACLWWAPIPSR